MKKIILVTSNFPYYGGEQFLETEVKYYCKNKNIEFVIIPLSYTNIRKRDIPSFIKVDKTFVDTPMTNISKVIYIFKSLKNKYFYKEFVGESFFNGSKIKYFLWSMLKMQRFYEKFDNFFKEEKNLENTIIYTYWHNEATYALQSLKDKYNYKLISRIHGYDLYKERRPFNYMPLKKHFINNIDKIYTITENANKYLNENYGFNDDVLELSRLGVDDQNIISLPSDGNRLHIVSCSFLVEVKQVDKIIESLKRISHQLPNISFRWSHIGDGVLYDELVSLANKSLKDSVNVTFNFIGNLANNDVYEFYKDNKIDVFINVSKSEGVPVSIMEAMSCHIPIIAPDVGGIKDMVLNGYNGYLLSKDCEVNEIVKALSDLEYFKDVITREHSYQIFLDKYNAKQNYGSFVEKLISLL